MFQNRIILLVIFLCCFILKLSFSRNVTDCYANDLNPYVFFGKKTSYKFVYEEPKTEDIHIPNCEPIQIWILSRHGARYPGNETLKSMHLLEDLKRQILFNHEEKKSGRLCELDLENLRTWKLNLTMSDTGVLSPQGKDELRSFGKRIRKNYPSLFEEGYNRNKFQFRHTKHNRTRNSARAFAEGLFGVNVNVWIPPGIVNDTLLHPFENCTYWLENVENSYDRVRERDLFLKGVQMTAVVQNVSQRLGFFFDLPIETILNIYSMCRYNKAWAVNDRSPWCAAFTLNELKILEYVSDIESYFYSGYGSKLNIKLGCSPLKDMLQRFEQLEGDAAQRKNQPFGIFYFTHGKVIIMMLSRMGLFNQGPIPLHYNYNKPNRDWRISKISPFAANFYAVFLKCNIGEYNRVMFFLNEKKINYEGCEAGLCSWSYIKNRFLDVLQHSNLDWCHSNSSRVEIQIFFLHRLLYAALYILIIIKPMLIY